MHYSVTKNILYQALSGILLIFAGGVIFNYPFAAVWLGLGLLLYAFILWYYPSCWMFFIPPLLALLDLAPWSGWFFLNEFDLFVIVTIAVRLLKKKENNNKLRLPGKALVLIFLFAISSFISMVIGLVPLESYDANSFSNYYGRYNSLRVAKGFFEAFALIPLLQRDLIDINNIKRYFFPGILIALSGVVIVGIWQRQITYGIFDFSNDYRITSTFSRMHNGGAYLDGFLILCLPFIASCLLLWQKKIAWLYTSMLFLPGLYILLVTFSRIVYASFGISFVILLAGFFYIYKLKVRFLIIVFVLTGMVVFIMLFVLKGDYMQNRFSRLNQDRDVRISHWKDAINKMSPDLVTLLFGMGPGSYPRTYFNNTDGKPRPAYYKFLQEDGNSFLKLFPGDPLYFEQKVSLTAGSSYILSLDVRGQSEKTKLSIPICEKTGFHSFKCKWLSIDVGNTEGKWRHRELYLNRLEFGTERGYWRRPVTIGLYSHGIVEIDNIQLLDSDGKRLILNGDFTEGMDRWYFSTDNHHPWHIFNIWVSSLFEQGWLCLILLNLMLLYVLVKLLKNSFQGDILSVIFLSSFVGFLTIGLVDSVFDSPRIAMLFFTMIFISILQPGWFKKSSI
ncbi:MAG: hypothetical protein GY931_04680 [Maribacter sp.]|nr:hypothetical protein [Candidatus Brocadiaceae bacterium]MCP4975435.1 hypothetical protein [Maribacter sp.]